MGNIQPETKSIVTTAHHVVRSPRQRRSKKSFHILRNGLGQIAPSPNPPRNPHNRAARPPLPTPPHALPARPPLQHLPQPLILQSRLRGPHSRMVWALPLTRTKEEGRWLEL